ncbi:hypothetical protein GCM10008101_27290 [Lysobacter xinjiangensis]|uniref:Transcription regulator PadR N-terminal domain-containing protein n=2 Tax=Cognatilysobacter xinjiangensis TaxID=546892 RepID=A0ABQ3CBI2_9GAMM|nr:hypothetical protein GCM10008101_27290 [Lysobacter xinjiangensis]
MPRYHHYDDAPHSAHIPTSCGPCGGIHWAGPHRGGPHEHGHDHPHGGRRGGHGGPGGRGRRLFGHGDMKLLLLTLIEPQPRHGYELIRLIEELFHGEYSPSPGVVYPGLSLLEDLGHVAVERIDGSRKLYAITDAGRDFLAANRESVDAVRSRAEHGARIAARRAVPDEVRTAMGALKQALADRNEWTTGDTARVAAILADAATRIADATPPEDIA